MKKKFLNKLRCIKKEKTLKSFSINPEETNNVNKLINEINDKNAK